MKKWFAIITIQTPLIHNGQPLNQTVTIRNTEAQNPEELHDKVMVLLEERLEMPASELPILFFNCWEV